MATILGGTGADTLDFNGAILNATVLGGTDTASLIAVTDQVDSSTIRGGSGNDTITFAGLVNSGTVVAGGAGADSFFNGATGTSIFAGAGNDSIYFDGGLAASKTGTTTYYFGKTDGKDTLLRLPYWYRWSCDCCRCCIRCHLWRPVQW